MLRSTPKGLGFPQVPCDPVEIRKYEPTIHAENIKFSDNSLFRIHCDRHSHKNCYIQTVRLKPTFVVRIQGPVWSRVKREDAILGYKTW